jgi:CheY-like chemotaxis protein
MHLLHDGFTPKRILIVEDNEFDLKLLTDILVVHGYETLQIGYGWEAFNLAWANFPDLILMDIQLYDISGLEITRRLSQSLGGQIRLRFSNALGKRPVTFDSVHVGLQRTAMALIPGSNQPVSFRWQELDYGGSGDVGRSDPVSLPFVSDVNQHRSGTHLG